MKTGLITLSSKRKTMETPKQKAIEKASIYWRNLIRWKHYKTTCPFNLQCDICMKLLPKLESRSKDFLKNNQKIDPSLHPLCPCNFYSRKYLLKIANEIIEFSKRR